MNFQSFCAELWQEPAIKWTVGITILAFVWYWLFNAIYETVERQEVIRAAKAWKERQRKRQRTKEAQDLWDSVNNLRRGQKEQRNGF